MLKELQVKLSRIIMYWLDEKNHKYQYIFDLFDKYGYKISKTKLEYIYTGIIGIDPTVEYGLNFSDLCVIVEMTGCSIQYLLTGEEKSIRDLAIEENKNELNKRDDYISRLKKQLEENGITPCE